MTYYKIVNDIGEITWYANSLEKAEELANKMVKNKLGNAFIVLVEDNKTHTETLLKIYR